MVIRDLMDLMRPHAEYTASGHFYKSRPLNGNAGGIPFDFSYVEPKTKAYARIFANVVGEDENLAIRTDERLDFKTGKSFVRMPDGKLYIVSEVMIDYDTAPKQALRMFAVPVGAQRLIRLKPYADGWSEER